MRTKTLLVFIFLLTVSLRLVAVVATFKGNDKVVSWEDVSIAKNLLGGKGYGLDNTWRTRMLYGNVIGDIDNKIPDRQMEGSRPTTLKQPIFPFLLTALFYVFGFGNFLAVFVIHSVLAGITAVTLYLALGAQSERIAVVCALGFAVYPPFVYQAATSPESTIALFLVLSLFVYQAATLQHTPAVKRFAVFGATAGLMVMTHLSTLLFATLAIPVVAFVVCDDFAKRLSRVTTAFLLLTAVVTPWCIRNYVTFGRFVVRAETGHELLKSRVEAGYGLSVPEETLLGLEKRGRILSEVDEGEMLTKAIRSTIASPTTAGSIMLMNLSEFWLEPPRYRDNYSLSYTMGRKIPYYLLLVLSIPSIMWSLIELANGMGAYVRSHLVECLAMLLILADTAVFSYWGAWNIRYHFPTELALSLFAAKAVVMSWSRVSGVVLHKRCPAV